MNATIQVSNFWKICCIYSFARHTERRFKVAVIGTTNCNLQSVLADWPDINLDDHQEASHIIDRTIASNVDLEVLRFMRQQPEFHYFEERIIGKLFECGQDMHWRRLILNQLRFSEGPLTKLATERQLDVLPPTAPQEIFVRTLAKTVRKTAVGSKGTDLDLILPSSFIRMGTWYCSCTSRLKSFT